MQVTLIRDFDALAALEAGWQSILDGCKPNHVFMSWPWLSTWWRYFGRGRELFVLVVRDKREVIGIVPLTLYVQPGRFAMSVRYLHFLGYRYGKRFADYMDIIAIRKEEVAEAAVDYLRQCQHLWDLIELWDIPQDSPTLEILRRIAGRLRLPSTDAETNRAPCLATDSDWDTFYRARKDDRRELEAKWKRLQERGEATVERVDASDVAGFTDCLLDLYARRRDEDAAALASYRDFYRGLAQALPPDWFRCSLLRLGGKAIAAQFSLLYHQRLYHMMPAYDPDFAKFSPGRILLRYLLEDCFRDARVKEFDFGKGREPYKYEWATGERSVYTLQISNAHHSSKIGVLLRRVPPSVRRPLIAASETVGRLSWRRLARPPAIPCAGPLTP